MSEGGESAAKSIDRFRVLMEDSDTESESESQIFDFRAGLMRNVVGSHVIPDKEKEQCQDPADRHPLTSQSPSSGLSMGASSATSANPSTSSCYESAESLPPIAKEFLAMFEG